MNSLKPIAIVIEIHDIENIGYSSWSKKQGCHCLEATVSLKNIFRKSKQIVLDIRAITL